MAPQAIVLGAMVAAAFAPSALAYYRCQVMATTLSKPCCKHAEHSGGDEAQLKAEPCCTKVTVALERASSELNPRADEPGAPSLIAVADASALLVAPAAPASTLWTRAHFDSGPPIPVRVCSLLI